MTLRALWRRAAAWLGAPSPYVTAIREAIRRDGEDWKRQEAARRVNSPARRRKGRYRP